MALKNVKTDDDFWVSAAELDLHMKHIGISVGKTAFVFVDGKPDAQAIPTLAEMIARGKSFRKECQRRGVRFLPTQVMRSVYQEAGLSVGPMVKARGNDFFVPTIE